MKTTYSLILAAALAIPAAASAQATPGADATGTWNASFNTQNGTIPATLTFKKTGDKITGTIASDQGSNDLEAELKGKALTVWFNYNANGQSIPIEMSGTIDGDTAKGTMTAGGSPAGDWSATRTKDTKDAKDTKDKDAKDTKDSKDTKDKDAKDPSHPSSPSYPSLSGDWSITLQMDQINATPALTLKQDGEKLTGTYTSQQYGKFPVTGTVKGKEVAFAVTLNIEGNSVAANYTGTLQDDGSMKGAVDIGGMMSGTWSATRAK